MPACVCQQSTTSSAQHSFFGWQLFSPCHCCLWIGLGVLTHVPDCVLTPGVACRQLAHIGQLRIEDDEEEEEWVDPSGGLLVNIYAACEEGDTEKLATNLADLQQTEHSINIPGMDKHRRQYSVPVTTQHTSTCP